jgi:phage terminase small subunit
MPRSEASAPIVKKRKPKQQRQHLTGKQRAFIEQYFTNGRNGAAAYRVVYRSQSSNQHCAVEASKLLSNPKISRIVASRDRMLGF